MVVIEGNVSVAHLLLVEEEVVASRSLILTKPKITKRVRAFIDV